MKKKMIVIALLLAGCSESPLATLTAYNESCMIGDPQTAAKLSDRVNVTYTKTQDGYICSVEIKTEQKDQPK